MRNIRTPFVLLLVYLLLIGCSSFQTRELSEVKIAVIQVAAKYLGHLIASQPREAEAMILWTDFVGNIEKSGITKQSFFEQISSIRGRWTAEEHPLVNLRILDCSVSGDNAVVRLQRHNKTNYPEVEIRLVWTGSGWLVQTDSLFGRDGLLNNFQVPHTEQ